MPCPSPTGTAATVIGRLVSQGTVSRAAANALGLLTPALTARQVADQLRGRRVPSGHL